MTENPTPEEDPSADDLANGAPPDDGPADESKQTTSSKRFRAATDEELDPQSFMWSDDRSAVRVRMFGGSIGKDRGDADFIGGVLRRLARALTETAEIHRAKSQNIAPPLLRNLAFGQSVVLELEIGRDEDVQLGLDGTRHSPTIDAAHTLGKLLAAPPSDLLPLALDLGEGAAAAYKRFLNIVAEGDVTLEWLSAESKELVVTSSVDARQDFAILDREGQQERDQTTVPGTLTMADSELRQFALTLPSELSRPPLLKGKHRVRGSFDEAMGRRLKQQGLWDSDVMATIEVTHDLHGTTATPRDPTYRLVDAQPLLPVEAPLFE